VVDYNGGGGKIKPQQCVLGVVVVIERLTYVIDVRMDLK